MIPEKFAEPAGFQWGDFTDANGARIRYGSLQPEGPVKGTMVIAPGFREPIEKYFEVMRDMTAKGFAVWAMDWRGQGGSDRFLQDNPQKMHSEGYAEHIATLHQFTSEVIKKSSGPMLLLGHSMGAHIGLRYLKEHAGVFDGAILNSTMMDVLTPGMPKTVARQLVRFAKAGNYLGKYIPGGSDWSEAENIFPGHNTSSDPDRFSVLGEIFKEKPELKMGQPTYGWVLHTFESIDILNNEDYLKSIKTPILMGVAGDDTIVDKAAEERACKLLPNCIAVDIPGAKHEVWMEREALRQPWLSRVNAFLEDRLNKHGLTPKKPKPNSVLRPPRFG
jgi:lysophospholipase